MSRSPASSPTLSSIEMRRALVAEHWDVHRDFCEIAIAEGGGVRAAGRVATDRETLELFARSLCDATDAPASIPPAPWRSRVSALLWWQWPTPAARAALPQQLASRAGLPITIGGLIAYHEGPVGPYNEVVGSPVLLRRGPAGLPRPVPGGRLRGKRRRRPRQLGAAEGPRVVRVRRGAGPGQGDRRRLGARRGGDGSRAALSVRHDGQVRSGMAGRTSPRGACADAGQAQLARVDVRHGRTSELGEWLVDGRHQGVLISGMQHLPEAGG